MFKAIRFFVVASLSVLYTPVSLAAGETSVNPYQISSKNYLSSPKPFSKVETVETNYRNKIGLSQEEDYVSDLGSNWSFSSLYYYRQTNRGVIGARLNYANKYSIGGEQFQVEAYPTITPKIYTALTFAVSNTSQRVFPKYQYLIEPYFSLPNGFEVSAGQRFIRSYGVNIYTYTGSIGKTIKNYFVWFRPYHYTPHSSDFFEVGIKRYADCLEDTYISLKLGTGKVPDIGDLPPLNQITTIRANTISVDGQFHATKEMLIQLGVGYARDVYPAGTVREITNGSVNLIWQF